MPKKRSSMSETAKEAVFPTREEVIHRQELFRERILAKFAHKYHKYRKVLKEYGVNIRSCESNYSFEEEVEMVVSQKRQKLMTMCSKHNVYNIRTLFRHFYHAVKKTKASRIVFKFQDIPDSDIRETIDAVAKELAFAYEYQIAMVKEENDVILICEYVVLCFFSYLKCTDAVFETKGLLTCVLDTNPTSSAMGETQIKTKITKIDPLGKRHTQKWRIQEILKQPGLRVARSGNFNRVGSGSNRFYEYYGCFTPYGSLCRPEKYGYRCPFHVLDEERNEYVMIYEDIISSRVDRRKALDDCNNIHHQYEIFTSCDHSAEQMDQSQTRKQQEVYMTEQCESSLTICSILTKDNEDENESNEKQINDKTIKGDLPTGIFADISENVTALPLNVVEALI